MAGSINPQLLAMFAQQLLANPGAGASALAGTGQSPPTIAPQASPFPVPRSSAPLISPTPQARAVQPPAEAPINPLEALKPPVQNPVRPAPQAGQPGLGGQINPQVMELIMQSLLGGGQPTAPAQSLGQILGRAR